MAAGGDGESNFLDTTKDFLRSFSIIGNDDSDAESEYSYSELSPIPETPGNLDDVDTITDQGSRNNDPYIPPAKSLPYETVFSPPVPFSELRENCWIPGQKVYVLVTDFERHAASKILNPNLYSIKVQHGDFEWTVYRRYKHIRKLHEQLALFRTKYRLHLHLPKRNLNERRKTIMADLKGMKKKQQSMRLPLRPEALVSEENIPSRMKQLQEYLQNLLKCKSYRNHPETLEFFEVTNLSFVNKLGMKSREGLVEKCSGGRRIECCGCLQKLHCAGTWNKRWLLIKDSFVAYMRPEDGRISDVMLMDAAFSVTYGLVKTGAPHGVEIVNFSRRLLIKSWTSRKAKYWAEHLEYVAKSKALDYTGHNRFGSFAPVREPVYARWFVDGRSYFEAVADALERAREEIYITDWWLSPEIYLKRPIIEGEKWRLDVTLKRKADQGVKVFILLYKEIGLALGLRSDYSKERLMCLSPNIKVLRHPDHIPGKGVILWAHHEKLVIVDQQIAFSGGLDLCYGRWDDHEHKMTDMGSITLKTPTKTCDQSTPLSGRQEASSHTDISVLSSEASPIHVNSNRIEQPRVTITPPTPCETDPHSHQFAADAGEYSGKEDQQQDQHDVDDCKALEREGNEVANLEETSQSLVKDDDLAAAGDNVRSKTGNVPDIVSSHHDKVTEDCEIGTSSIPLQSDLTSYSNHQPIEANVRVTTLPDTTIESLDKGQDRQFQHGNSLIKQERFESRLEVNDSESFDESVMEDIRQSMEPFKDFQIGEAGTEVRHVVIVGDVNLGLDSPMDKEIICLEDEENLELGEELDNVHKNNESAIRASHLWTRRSNRKSLELAIPVYRKTLNKGKGARSDDVASPKVSLVKKGELTMTEGERKRASNTSSDSRGSESDPLTKERLDSRGNENNTPRTPSSISSMSQAASAFNALRKMMHKKEQNNNTEDLGRQMSAGDPSNRARRRWKLALNVSKFDTIMRSPQVPDQLDESVFYNWNDGKHPTAAQTPRSKLVQSLKEGVDKLTHKSGGKRGSVDFSYDNQKNLSVPGIGMHLSKSEENIEQFGLEGSTKLWIGKDYVNFVYKDFENLDQPFEDFIDRTSTPRMPWHDIGSSVSGKAARDLARHFIGRWNATKLEKCKKNHNFPWLLPKSTSSKCHTIAAFKDYSFEVKLQVLRSSCQWSAGVVQTENSIHEAYVHCIENAREFIYIENQFFITQTEPKEVQNHIGNALYKRILRAHRSGRDFKVYVVMPLLPAFEGEFGTTSGSSIQAITHWNYSSICRGENSLIERLRKEVPNPNKYIVFCGLRTWDKLSGKLMTELVYVHSKMMIVDDDTVIIGSANINDRSLLGSRDSEIAIMFEDIHHVDVEVRGRRQQGGKFASTLRRTVFREHLGLIDRDEDVDLGDITSDAFYKNIWCMRAAVNTTCYEKVFHCLPTDNVRNFAELKQYKQLVPLAQSDPKKAEKLLAKVKGYLVLIPLHFLEAESLTPKIGSKESVLPTYTWT